MNNSKTEYKKCDKLPAFLRDIFMSLIASHVSVFGLNTSALFFTIGPSCPPTTYSSPSTTPTPFSLHYELTQSVTIFHMKVFRMKVDLKN